jgi:HEAT repeat protein
MAGFMNKCFWRLVFLTGSAVLLASCGNRETKEALQKEQALADQKQYEDANKVLLDALQARDIKIRAAANGGSAETLGDQASEDAMLQKVEADPEILKMERAQIPLYLRLDRTDKASAVYVDILAGHPGDTVVFDALQDKDPIIRVGAVRILGLAGKPDAIDALAGMTKDSDQDVRRAAVVALGTINDHRTVPPLIAALKDSYWDVRSEAANALGQEQDPLAVKALLDAVSDSDSTVEQSAETALLYLAKHSGGHGDDFFARLNDSNPKVVLVSAVCLGIMKDPRSIPVLERLTASDDQTTRLDAVKALGETGDPSVIQELRITLKSSDVNMRGWSIIGLGNLKDQGSIPDLTALANDPNQPASIQKAAAAALQEITAQGTPSASANGAE